MKIVINITGIKFFYPQINGAWPGVLTKGAGLLGKEIFVFQ